MSFWRKKRIAPVYEALNPYEQVMVLRIFEIIEAHRQSKVIAATPRDLTARPVPEHYVVGTIDPAFRVCGENCRRYGNSFADAFHNLVADCCYTPEAKQYF